MAKKKKKIKLKQFLVFIVLVFQDRCFQHNVSGLKPPASGAQPKKSVPVLEEKSWLFPIVTFLIDFSGVIVSLHGSYCMCWL
jgi:hypothetical protein